MTTPAEPYDARVQLRVTKDQWLKVQALAFALDVPVSSVIRQTINDFFDHLEGRADEALAELYNPLTERTTA